MIGKQASGLIWDDLRVFLAVARAGTLSGAAAQLNLGLATVSRRIERLEGDIGRPLFLRQQTGCRLTGDGAALCERAGVELLLRVESRDGRFNPAEIGLRLSAEASVWFCGPAGFGSALREAFTAQDLPAADFHQELFDMR